MALAPQTVTEIDTIVATAQATGRVPSIVAAVVRGGVVAHTAGAGGLPAPDPGTQYRIGSITKTLTAALVLGLRDAGALDLDDPLAEHLDLPDLPRIRLRQLLAHVAGLSREPDGDWWERSPGVEVKQLVEGLSAGKVRFGAYQRHHYSNLAYGLLGAVVANHTGGSWWDAVSARLLAPLGMSRTTYLEQVPFARGYVVHPWHGTLREEPRHDAGAMAPAGQLWSTTADLGRWAAFLADPDPSILAPATVAEMTQPVVMSDLDSWRQGHGLGLELWRRGDRIFVGHTGSMPGYLAVLVVHRPSRTGVVAFANGYTLHGSRISALGLSIMEAVLDREPSPGPAPWHPGGTPPAEVAPLCGRWWWMGREFEARWDPAEQELVLIDAPAGRDEWRFRPDGTDRWLGRTGENAGESMVVHRDRSGKVIALDIATFIFRRDPLSDE
ncbi:MAG TPA: serine hydrolase domain-containing protein [Micromonosporaceae bacterium]